MDGGCLNIWLKNATTNQDRLLLQEYAKYVDHLGVSFTIRHREPRITGKSEERKLLKVIGYIPQEELVICGFADFIFQAAEEILSHYEGYLQTGIPLDELERYQGLEYRIKVRTTNTPREHVYQLLKIETVRAYFNASIDKTVREICSLKKFLGQDLAFTN